MASEHDSQAEVPFRLKSASTAYPLPAAETGSGVANTLDTQPALEAMQLGNDVDLPTRSKPTAAQLKEIHSPDSDQHLVENATAGRKRKASESVSEEPVAQRQRITQELQPEQHSQTVDEPIHVAPSEPRTFASTENATAGRKRKASDPISEEPVAQRQRIAQTPEPGQHSQDDNERMIKVFTEPRGFAGTQEEWKNQKPEPRWPLPWMQYWQLSIPAGPVEIPKMTRKQRKFQAFATKPSTPASLIADQIRELWNIEPNVGLRFMPFLPRKSVASVQTADGSVLRGATVVDAQGTVVAVVLLYCDDWPLAVLEAMLEFAKKTKCATDENREVSAGQHYMGLICEEIRSRRTRDGVGELAVEYGIMEEDVVKACSEWCERNGVMVS